MRSKKNLLKHVQVVSFDVGFTLIYTEPRVGEVYAGHAARFGYHLSGEQVHSRFRKVWLEKNALNREKKTGNALTDEERSYQWWKEIFKESIGDILAPGDLEKLFKVCYEEYARGVYWRLYPEVEHTLTTLRSNGFRLVVLSNWDLRLKQTLKELHLDHFFEKIYISTQIGYAKPNPEAFQYMIDDLNIPAHAILHVGDTPEDDVLGAQQANIRAVCIDRRGRYKSIPDQIPVISTLVDLLD